MVWDLVRYFNVLGLAWLLLSFFVSADPRVKRAISANDILIYQKNVNSFIALLYIPLHNKLLL